MRQQTTAEARTARPRLRKLAASTLVVLIVALPVLLAFARIDITPTNAEVARVQEAVFPESAKVSQPLLMFYGSAVPETAPALWDEQRDRIVTGGRLAGMLALFSISSLLYLLLLIVRGRATAAFGCLGLCVLPPVAYEGYVLRAEQCATMFGVLGVVLIAGFPLMLQRRDRGVMPFVAKLCLMCVVGVTFGVARACQHTGWIYLVVPASGLLLSVMTTACMFPRAVRRISILYWPFRAAARRYLPWMFLVLFSFGLTLAVLAESGGEVFAARSKSQFGLMPDSVWMMAVILVFAGIGGSRMLVGVGIRLGRLRRVRPDTVLFLYVAALLTHDAFAGEGFDRLPAAPALACLIGDGVMTAAVLTLSWWARRRST